MRLEIDLNQATRKSGEMAEQKRALLNNLGSVRAVKTNCSYNSNARLLPISAINRIINEMNDEIADYDKLINALNSSVEYYRNCERKITNSSSDSDIPTDNGNSSDDTTQWEIFTWADIWNLVGEAGIIGSGISAIGSIFTSSTIADKVLSSADFICEIIGNATDAKDAGADWAKYLFGLDDAFEGLDDASTAWNAFKSTLKKEYFDDFTIDVNATKAKKAGVISKWAGHAISFVTNGFENFGEFKGQGAYGAARGTSEAIIETGVDIGLEVLATAAVSAGAVALGVTAAPAVVIGGIATAAVIGANALCKWATGGKDIGEVVADGICDLGERAINNVVERGRETVENIRNFGEAVSEGVSTAWSGFCGLFA